MEIHPFAWMFFIPFISVVTFIVVKLVAVIVVDAVSEINKDEMLLLMRFAHMMRSFL